MQCWFSFYTSFCDKQVLLTCNVGNKAKPGKRRERKAEMDIHFVPVHSVELTEGHTYNHFYIKVCIPRKPSIMNAVAVYFDCEMSAIIFKFVIASLLV